MISFPSTLNTGGSNINLPTQQKRSIGDLLKTIGKTAVNNFVNNTVNGVVGGVWGILNGAQTKSGFPNIEGLPYDFVRNAPELVQRAGKVTDGTEVIPEMLAMRHMFTSQAAKELWYENALTMNADMYSLMNTYKSVYNYGIVAAADGQKLKEDGSIDQVLVVEYPNKSLSPSLFNPFYGVQRIGPTNNTPLLNGTKPEHVDWTDCSIATLCKLSAQPKSELGQAKYKYSDFMYCKDLGMPNNRLITLRKFTQPVGDIIFGSRVTEENNPASFPGDAGRLVGYFDTDENRLEDILNYSFNASWKELTSKIDQQKSQEDDRKSPVGMLLNSLSSDYANNMLNSTAGENNIFDHFVGKWAHRDGSWYKDNRVLYNYDENKIYEPKDTIRETNIYEGKLSFNHEFTLTFVYKLRSYDNINPKAALLDLLGNITTVCYRRGNFWGGRNQIIGPQPNMKGWKKFQDMYNQVAGAVGEAVSTVGGQLMSGDISGALGSVGEYIKGLGGSAVDAFKDPKIMSQFKELSTQVLTNAGKYAKGAIHDRLGRPQLYAFNSLLTNDNTGLWHVTIGNPRNPIISMGNLIITNTTVQHFGPLGMDDFPTGLKVTVTLKHARPRDMMDIQKMYTKGIAAMYVPLTDSVNTDKKDEHGASASANTYKENENGSKTITASPHFDTSTYGGRMYVGDNDIQRIARNLDELR